MISFPDAETIAAADIPALLGAIATYKAQLMVRLLAVPAPAPNSASPFLDAKQMGERLGVPESWVRTEARAGRIPCVMVGRYVRFRATAVEAALQVIDKAKRLA